jgi:hypothetical protein
MIHFKFFNCLPPSSSQRGTNMNNHVYQMAIQQANFSINKTKGGIFQQITILFQYLEILPQDMWKSFTIVFSHGFTMGD